TGCYRQPALRSASTCNAKPRSGTTARGVVDLASRLADKTMLIERIYEWARSEPTKPAIISNDVPLNYAAFARAIDAARRFLQPHGLPPGRTAIVLGHSPVRAWTTVLALRSFGLTTVYLNSIEDAERLKLRNVAVVVVCQPKLNSLKLEAKTWGASM